ncbi:carboxymuconolactone decarboxylase family protein, partial [Actinoplanes siamensis]
MIGKLVRRPVLGQIRHVRPVPPGSAHGVVAAVYQQMERDFGMLAPPVALHSPEPPVLAAVWAMLRETLLVPGSAGRGVKETVAAAVSAANRCPYCVDVHGATMTALGLGPEAAAVEGGRGGGIADPVLRDVVTWAGVPGAPPPGLPAGWLPELAGVVAVFHYLNRMVSVFLVESPLRPGLSRRARARMLPTFGRLLRFLGTAEPVPGAALGLLPAAPGTHRPAWAPAGTVLAATFARAAATIEDAARTAVPPAVREVVAAAVGRWDGR